MNARPVPVAARLRLLTPWLLVLALAGCARTPNPELYLVDLPLDDARAGAGHGLAVGIGPLDLPAYLDRPQIVTRDGQHRLHAAPGHVWAEPLHDSALRVLTASVGATLASNRVFPVPRRARTALDWRVEIEIERFDGVLGGAVVLAARWSVYQADNRQPRLTRTSLIEQPAAAGDYTALVEALSAALARLGEDIARAVAGAQAGA